MNKFFSIITVAIISVSMLSSSIAAMHGSFVSYGQDDLKKQITQIINDANNQVKAKGAGQLLAKTLIELDAQWAWNIFDKLISSPGFNLIDSRLRASQRNVGSWTLAYLHLQWKDRAEITNYTKKWLSSPDLEEKTAALRAWAYAISINSPWKSIPAKNDPFREAFDLILSQKHRFVSTEELFFTKFDF